MSNLVYFIVLSLAYVAVSNDVGKAITIHNGEVFVFGYNNCSFTNNGRSVNYTSNETSGRVQDVVMFGLITWKCDKIYSGASVSFFDCGTCSMYCVYNQYIERCRKETIPIAIAIIISTIVSLVILTLALTVFRRRINQFIMCIIMYFVMRNDVKRADRIRRYNKATGKNIEVKFKKIKYSNEYIMKEIEKRRLELSGKNDALYAEIIYNRSAELREIDRMLSFSEARARFEEPTAPKNNSKANSYSKAAVAAVALTTIVQPTYSCDQMLYLKSNGKICYNDKCYDLSTYSLMILDGQTACFHDLNNDKFSIKLNKINHITRFSKIYDTSEYDIKNTMTWNCLGSGICWYGSECGNGYMLNTLEKYSINPHGYGCHMTSVSCVGAMCTHGTSCVWYRWEIIPDAKRMAHVYNAVGSFWEAEITVDYKGMTKHLTFNSNNPKYDLNDILNGIMDHMPIYVYGAEYETPFLRNGLVEHENNYYNVDVSPQNMPIGNMIGDLQMDKDGRVIFYTSTIDCSTDSCAVKCRINEPSLRRLKKNSPYNMHYANIDKRIIYSEDWINYRVRVMGHVTLTFGNVELKELVVERPKCLLDIIMTYACEGCLEQPRAVISSDNVKQEGALDYMSNCTWDRPYLSCNSELYEIIQISKNKICRITIPMLNQTLDISFEYEYRGMLSSMKAISAETSMDIFNNIVSDPNFYQTLIGSISGFLLLSAISTIIIKLSRVGVLAIGRREVARA